MDQASICRARENDCSSTAAVAAFFHPQFLRGVKAGDKLFSSGTRPQHVPDIKIETGPNTKRKVEGEQDAIAPGIKAGRRGLYLSI